MLSLPAACRRGTPSTHLSICINLNKPLIMGGKTVREHIHELRQKSWRELLIGE